jgi:hypothetical protein
MGCYLGPRSLEGLSPGLDQNVRITRLLDCGERDEDNSGSGNLNHHQYLLGKLGDRQPITTKSQKPLDATTHSTEKVVATR